MCTLLFKYYCPNKKPLQPPLHAHIPKNFPIRQVDGMDNSLELLVTKSRTAKKKVILFSDQPGEPLIDDLLPEYSA